MSYFPATLGPNERRVTYGVGYGVALVVGIGAGLGLPIVFEIAGAEFSVSDWLLIALCPAFVFYSLFWARRYRPIGFIVGDDEVRLDRLVGKKSILRLDSLQEISFPAAPPAVNRSIGPESSQGVYGSWGKFQSAKHGTFDAYLTDQTNTVQMKLADGSFLFASPDDKTGFAAAVANAAAARGIAIDVKPAITADT
jgi:hypothetical protein